MSVNVYSEQGRLGDVQERNRGKVVAVTRIERVTRGL